jgi:hypothetical protein
MAALALAGRIPIPVPGGIHTAGRGIEDEALVFLEPGVTTRQEVTEHLGEPLIIWRDENVLVYEWEKVHLLLLWGGMGGAGLTGVPTNYVPLLRFDAAGKVQKFERTVRPVFETYGAFLRNWVAQPASGESEQAED